METLGIEYFVFVVVACLGVLQLAAANAGLTGLLFFKRNNLAVAFGGGTVVWAFWWFFSIGDRNQPGLAGAELFAGFSLGVLVAVALTLALSSAVDAFSHSRGGENFPMRSTNGDSHGEGLDALRSHTYHQAVRRGWANRRESVEVAKR